MDFDKNIPIYLQLLHIFKTNILNQSWPLGSSILSIRELAITYQANPNTVLKALTELEAIGLIVSERTIGKRVCNDQALITSLKEQMLHQSITQLFQQASDLGFTTKEVIQTCKKVGEQHDSN